LTPGAVIGHGHVTDVHLLALAVHQGGKLATVDRRIPVTAVHGGADALEQVLP
jgi:predicted nucleic acid-binding protein